MKTDSHSTKSSFNVQNSEVLINQDDLDPDVDLDVDLDLDLDRILSCS